MKLKAIHIYANWESAGGYRGTVEFEGKEFKTELKFDRDLADQLIKLVADKLVENSKLLAKEMTTEIIDAQTALLEISK